MVDTDLAAKLALLRRTPYFRSIAADELQQIALHLLRERRYHAGEVISRRGDPGPGLCIVLSGHVRTLTTSPEGREQTLKVFGPGRTFGEIPVFDGEPLPADAVAISETAIAVIARSDLFDILKRHPDVCLEVIRLFASRLRAYKQLIEDLSLRDVTGRVARLLLDRARGQPTLVEDGRASTVPYTQAEIAAIVGSVREVVQRAVKALERMGFIESARGRIRIIDLDALAAWTDLVFERRTPRPRAKTSDSPRAGARIARVK